LAEFIDPELGSTSVNLASIQGSGSASNVVPDNCQFVLDIRPSSPQINADLIINQLTKSVQELGGQLTDPKIKFDFGSWLTPQAELANLDLKFKQINNSGYIDIQMLWQIFNRPKCLTIGAGTQKTAHASNEYVEINKLNQLPAILLKIITNVTIKL